MGTYTNKGTNIVNGPFFYCLFEITPWLEHNNLDFVLDALPFFARFQL
jgi:hypothetical protein